MLDDTREYMSWVIFEGKCIGSYSYDSSPWDAMSIFCSTSWPKLQEFGSRTGSGCDECPRCTLGPVVVHYNFTKRIQVEAICSFYMSQRNSLIPTKSWIHGLVSQPAPCPPAPMYSKDLRNLASEWWWCKGLHQAHEWFSALKEEAQ